MQLTKEHAIQEHRKMWNWIADQYKKRSRANVCNLKDMYLHEKKYERNTWTLFFM